MVDKMNADEPRTSELDGSGPTVRKASGHRAPDTRDAMAELAERAQLISQEAGTKVASAMKDVISAAAGLAGFAIESARDLVQYMVKRGQMTQDEADKLIREAEAAHGRRPAAERERPTATKVAAERAAQVKAEAAARAAESAAAAAAARAHQLNHAPGAAKAGAKAVPAKAPAKKPPATKPAKVEAKAKKPAAKAAKAPRPAAKKAPPKKKR